MVQVISVANIGGGNAEANQSENRRNAPDPDWSAVSRLHVVWNTLRTKGWRRKMIKSILGMRQTLHLCWKS